MSIWDFDMLFQYTIIAMKSNLSEGVSLSVVGLSLEALDVLVNGAF